MPFSNTDSVMDLLRAVCMCFFSHSRQTQIYTMCVTTLREQLRSEELLKS